MELKNNEVIEAVNITYKKKNLVFKLSGTSLRDVTKIIKFLILFSEKKITWIDIEIPAENDKSKYKFKKNMLIELTIDNMLLKKGSEVMVLQLRNSYINNFFVYAKKNKIEYSKLPDLDITRHVKQLIIPFEYRTKILGFISSFLVAEQKEMITILELIDKKIAFYTDKKKSKKEVLNMYTAKGKDSIEKEDFDKIFYLYQGICRTLASYEKQKEKISQNINRIISLEDYKNINQISIDYAERFANEYDNGISQFGCCMLNSFLEETPYAILDIKDREKDEIDYLVYFKNPNIFIKREIIEKDSDCFDNNITRKLYKYSLFKNDNKKAISLTNDGQKFFLQGLLTSDKKIISYKNIIEKKINEERRINHREKPIYRVNQKGNKEFKELIQPEWIKTNDFNNILERQAFFKNENEKTM